MTANWRSNPGELLMKPIKEEEETSWNRESAMRKSRRESLSPY
jgi:hypothetical protein